METQDLHDISDATKLCELAMTSAADVYSIADKIDMIDDQCRPKLLRRSDRGEIAATLLRWRGLTQRSLIARGFSNPVVTMANSEHGNFSASDLIVSDDGDAMLNVETKFGGATNANIGVERMSDILGAPAFFLGKDDRMRMLSSLPEHHGCDASFTGMVISVMRAYMNDYVNSMDWVGIRVNGHAIRDMVMSSGAAGNSAAMTGDYDIYVYKRRRIDVITPMLTGDEEWDVSASITSSASSVRLSYRLVNESTEDTIRATLNNKNSTYVLVDGDTVLPTTDKHADGALRIPSRLQLGVPSYNVWYKSGDRR